MRATIWSLAALTGMVVAAPGSDAWGAGSSDGWGSPEGYSSASTTVLSTASLSSSSTCTESETKSIISSSSIPVLSSYLSSTAVISSSLSVISSSLSMPTKYAISSAKVSSASASIASKASSVVSKAKSTYTSVKKVSSTITIYTTIYTSVGTATTTKSNGGWTETSTYLTTDVKTSTVTSSIEVTPVSAQSAKSSSQPADVTVVRTTKVYTTVCPSGSASGSGSSSLATPATTVTSYTSIFTTICPVTATSVSGSVTLTKTYDVTSKITSTIETTVFLTTSTLTYGSDTIPVTIPLPTASGVYPSGYRSSAKSHASHSKHSSHSGSHASKASKASRTQSKSTVSASVVPTSTSTSTISRPMPYGPDCVPCQGQPGSDPNAFCGYTINSNSYEVTPQTCVHREYEFTLSNMTISPDGVERYGLVINGQVPGPKVEANWGDWISITLHNTLQNNGTSLHMHGFRQFYTNEMDGVASITQCPTAPGDSITYTFRADNYGTSWYHSHFSLQTYEGFFGPVVIHGPSSAAYDVEETVVLSDWNHIPVDMMFDAAQFVGPPPANGPRVLDTGLINGLNVWGADGDASQTGERFVLTVKPGKKYLLRIVSSAIQATFKFYVDGHSFTVVSTDFVPINPYTTNVLNINIGQRYNVILEANQTPGNYWMRADNQEACGSITNGKNIKGIVRYEGADAVLPTSTAYVTPNECVDEPLASLVPVVPLSVGAASETISENIFIKPYVNDPSVYRWTLSDAFFQADYDTPSLGGVLTNGDVPYTGNLVIDAPKLGEWIYIIIDSAIPVPHPIHLHGHDFMVLSQGPGLYNSATTVLNLQNPPRRDVALMPGSGHLVIAFITDNPGVWLLHCHIGWHSAMGFALQIVENLENIAATVIGADQISDTCANWNAYAHANDIKVLDAGI